jgi:trehalose 6-phosphate phosphatase
MTPRYYFDENPLDTGSSLPPLALFLDLLVPCPSWNKGAAAFHIMAGMGKEYLPVCLGDDVTDETLFETFRGKGVTIKVGLSKNSIATYYLKDQREVLCFLKNINDLLSPSKELS